MLGNRFKVVLLKNLPTNILHYNANGRSKHFKKERKVMKKLVCIVLAVFMVLGLAACQTGETPTETASTGTSVSSEVPTSATAESVSTLLTDAGTPRNQTLVIDSVIGQWKGEMIFNPYLSGCVNRGMGFRGLVYEYLWDIDTTTGEQYCLLADSFAEPTDDTYTKFEVKLKQGIKWSDGVDFTADDVVFTSEMLLGTPDLSNAGSFSALVKSISKVDDYTVLIETNKKETRLEQKIGSVQSESYFVIVPKHIWENEDPLTFVNPELIMTGPYKLKEYETNGNYFLFEKREDADCSAAGKVWGIPVPKYVLIENWGEEETTVMAAIDNKLDCLVAVTMEGTEALFAGNPEATSWYEDFPYGFITGEVLGIIYNCAAVPFDKTNVRWALTLVTNGLDLSMAAYNGGATMTPIAASSTATKVETYVKPMLPYLQSFALSDGYKPFNADYSSECATSMDAQGITGLPTDEESLKAMFGQGWWKNDTVEAEKLLLAEGFTRDGSGKWLKPDGTPWQITFTCSENGREVNMAYAIVNAWVDFGIDAVVNSVDGNTFNTSRLQGTSDCWLGQINSSELIDMGSPIATWHSSFVKPVGENTVGSTTSGATTRFVSADLDAIIDELNGLLPTDPRATELTIEYFKTMIVEAPFVAICGKTHVCPVTTHYWTGFANADNPYVYCDWWYTMVNRTVANVQPTGNLE